MAGDLGCFAPWSWEIRTRLGQLVARPKTNAWTVAGTRRLSAMGNATLTATTDCCTTIDDVETGDELFLYREGSCKYYGVCKKATRQAPFGEATIESFDRTWWWSGRYFAFIVDWTGRDAGLNLRDLIAANNAVDPATSLTWVDPPPAYLLGVELSIITEETSHFDLILASIANAVVDYTILGDKMLVGTNGLNVPALPALTSESWTDGRFTTVQDHDLFATEVYIDGRLAVFARYPPPNPLPPFVPPPNPRWGNRRVRIADTLLADQAACLTRAKAEYAQRNPPPRRLAVPDGALVDRRINFDDLIPGAAVVVEAPTTCEDTTLISMLLATVQWNVQNGEEQSVTAALVEKGQELAST